MWHSYGWVLLSPALPHNLFPGAVSVLGSKKITWSHFSLYFLNKILYRNGNAKLLSVARLNARVLFFNTFRRSWTSCETIPFRVTFEELVKLLLCIFLTSLLWMNDKDCTVFHYFFKIFFLLGKFNLNLWKGLQLLQPHFSFVQ